VKLNKKINQRNLILLTSASQGLTLNQVNDKLDSRLYDPITDLDWALWTNFYYPLAKANVVYEKELIYYNRTLSWFANDLKMRHNKKTIS
jgi:hypothetical protein